MNHPGRTTTRDATNRLLSWPMLGIVLLVAALPLALKLGAPQVTDPLEARSIATARETHRAVAAPVAGRSPLARLAPVYRGRTVIDRPPGHTWLNLTFLSVFAGDGSATPSHVLMARSAAVVMMLLTVACVFWSAHSIGGGVPAIMSALVLASCPFFLTEGRVATGITTALGWSGLSFGAALWALRPLRPSPGLARQAIGWGISGVTLGFALLTMGGAAIPLTFFPLLVILLTVPDRFTHGLGLLASLCIAALISTPWAVHLLGLDAGAIGRWRTAWTQNEAGVFTTLFGSLDRHALSVAVLTCPWTLWLLAALAQPFSTSSGGVRRRMLIGWTWFVTTCVMIPWIDVGAQPYVWLLAAVPASIMIGQLFRRFVDLADEGRYARLWRWFRWPHGVAMIVASIALPLWLQCQDWLIAHQFLETRVTDQTSWWYWSATGVALLSLALVGAQYALANFPGRALAAWSAWGLAAAICVTLPAADGPRARSAATIDATLAARVLHGRQAYYLINPEAPDDTAVVDPIFHLYFDRPLIPVSADDLAELTATEQPLYALAPIEGDLPAWLTPIESLDGSGLRLISAENPAFIEAVEDEADVAPSPDAEATPR